MRPLRHHVINLAAAIGILASGIYLLSLTGFLFHILTPRIITLILANSAAHIYKSPGSWWMGMLIGWAAFVWSCWLLISHRAEKPVLIKEDELGTVEVTPTALARLAHAEVAAQGSPRPIRTEFVRKFGRPVLQVWCDLTRCDNGEGPVARGEKLKRDVERRLREDFSLEKVRVEVIHQPSDGGRAKVTPLNAA
jgi:hypothetical protein